VEKQGLFIYRKSHAMAGFQSVTKSVTLSDSNGPLAIRPITRYFAQYRSFRSQLRQNYCSYNRSILQWQKQPGE